MSVVQLSTRKPIWIARDYLKCSGCRKCEVSCSLFHEKRIWPEASRIRVFMLIPGAEIPHFCAQCHDHPCVESCAFDAMSVSETTRAVLVDKDKCTGCGQCIRACPGKIPHLHPVEKYALICDLCGGDPQCVRVCQEGGWGALWIAERHPDYEHSWRLYARRPKETLEDLVISMFGEKGEDLI